MLLPVGGLILSGGELGAIDGCPSYIARRILMTLFDEIAWLVREDEMDCHGQAWDVEKCGACPAAAFVSDSSVHAAGEFTGEHCPKWLSFVQSCGESCEPSPEDISEICEEWRTNTKCYQSTEE